MTDQYANNRPAQSREATGVRELGMRKFKSVAQDQRFFTTHAAVQNLFNLGIPGPGLALEEGGFSGQ